MSEPQGTNRDHLADLIAEVPSGWKTNFRRVVALLLVASLLTLTVVGAVAFLVLAFAALKASIRNEQRRLKLQVLREFTPPAGFEWLTGQPARRLIVTTLRPAAPVRSRPGDHEGATRVALASAVPARARAGNLSEAQEWEGAARAVLYPDRRRRGELRASDAERDKVIARLCEHAVAGRLDISELEERLSLALAARTRAEIAALERDLPWLRQ